MPSGPVPHQQHYNLVNNMKFAFASILALALAAVGVLSAEVRAPQPDLAQGDIPAVDRRAQLSNGERFSRGLPPNPPARHYDPARAAGAYPHFLLEA
jgi:hypothetical protein